MDVNKSLSDQCKRQLRTTPFGWLLNLHCNIKASGRMLEVMLPIDCNQSHVGGSMVETLLVTHLKTASPWERTKLVTLLTKPSIKVPDRIWACEHLGIGQKNAEINQPFPRFLAWTHQRMFSKKVMEAFSNSANVLCVLAAMPWEQHESVVQEAMEILQETHGSSHTAILKNDGAGPSNTTQTPSNQCSPSKVVKRGKPAKKKAKAAMVDLASSPSKWDNEGKAAAAMVDLVSSPSKGATSVSGVDSNEVAISTETYEITGRDVSSLLGDQAQEESSRWISTTVVDYFKDVLMEKLTESGHPPPYINYIITVHGGTTILASAQSTSTQRSKRTKKGKQPIQDDQPGPESVFCPSWVRAIPKNCNRLIPLILLSAACIIAKSFGAAMRREVGPSGCPYMAPRIQE
uniref:Uncharacterized protein n=1 Tax=Fagus sylvatica TaxID=28930 RepID=A0A2N9F670_FAGSY